MTFEAFSEPGTWFLVARGLAAALAGVALLVVVFTGVQSLRARRTEPGGRQAHLLRHAAREPDASYTSELVRIAVSSSPRASAEALLVIGTRPQSYGGAVEAVTAVLRSRERGARAVASFALERIGVAFPALLGQLVRDPSPEVRSTALRALARESTVGPGGFGREAVARLAVDAVKDADENVRAWACRALAVLRPPAADKCLVEAFEDRSPSVARAAIAAAGRLGSTEVLEALVARLRDDSPASTPDVLEALSRTPDPPVSRWLSDAAFGPTPARVAALRALGTRGVPELANGLLPLLGDRDRAIRREVVRSIGGIARAAGPGSLHPAVVRQLAARYPREESRSTREAIVAALGASGTAQSRRELETIRDGLAREPVPDHLILERLANAIDVADTVAGGSCRTTICSVDSMSVDSMS